MFIYLYLVLFICDQAKVCDVFAAESSGCPVEYSNAGLLPVFYKVMISLVSRQAKHPRCHYTL